MWIAFHFTRTACLLLQIIIYTLQYVKFTSPSYFHFFIAGLPKSQVSSDAVTIHMIGASLDFATWFQHVATARQKFFYHRGTTECIFHILKEIRQTWWCYCVWDDWLQFQLDELVSCIGGSPIFFLIMQLPFHLHRFKFSASLNALQHRPMQHKPIFTSPRRTREQNTSRSPWSRVLVQSSRLRYGYAIFNFNHNIAFKSFNGHHHPTHLMTQTRFILSLSRRVMTLLCTRWTRVNMIDPKSCKCAIRFRTLFVFSFFN